jgi:glycosyltransferase involved in cell wall biosynthesis
VSGLVSVVVEGYNESLDLGCVDDTMCGLARQSFPLDAVEVILVGTAAQAREWQRTYASGMPFRRVEAVGADGAHYYQLKNVGAQQAAGEIIAFIDSDTCPEPGWLEAIASGIRSGADAVAGLSLFRSDSGFGPYAAAMEAAASISWGFVVGGQTRARSPRARGFLSHNVGFRAETFRRHPYRTDLGRTCAGSFLYRTLTQSGATIVLQPAQRVAHTFSLRWWLSRLHVRFGYEVYLLRRLNDAAAARWVMRLSVLEPLLTMVWHSLLDVPQWLRFSRLLGAGATRRIALLPLVVGMSLAARGAEMVGMYRAILSPEAMRRFAESN